MSDAQGPGDEQGAREEDATAREGGGWPRPGRASMLLALALVLARMHG